MSKFRLKIVTPEGTYRDEDVDIINFRATDGCMGIMAHHIPLATGVQVSEMNYRVDNKKYEFAVGGGFLYVSAENTVTLIANTIESQEDIDLKRAQEAEKRARARLSSRNEEVDTKRAELALKKALVRQQVKNLK
jgi:F-type H+-transporting ATPase subunit epsilon